MKLREWQEKAFPLWWAKKRGIVKVVTGGGKTIFAIHCLTKYLEEEKDNSINLKNAFNSNNLFVAESGIKSQDDIDTLKAHDIHVFLIGESLMKGDFA